MKKVNRWILAASLLFPAAAARADRGDLFLTLGPAVQVFETGMGGELGLQLGVNDVTDFFLAADLTLDPFGSGTDLRGQYQVGSMFTPYEGEIRPRIGGSLGVVHWVRDGGDGDEGAMNAALHIQGLYDASDALRLFAEVQPYLSFGEVGDIGTLVKVGLQFRLSK